MRKRFLRYSALNGYGFHRRGTSLPLATGVYVHEALAGVLRWAKEEQAQGRVVEVESAGFAEAIRPLVREQIENYKQLVAARGFLNLEGEEHTAIIEEQAALIEGLTWGWCRVMLPEILDKFWIVDVEREELFQASEDIVQMSRPDFVLRRKADGLLSVHDFKTTGFVSDAYAAEYRNSIQMAVGTVALEQRLGEPVRFYYIHALVKGVRKPGYNTETSDYDGPKQQHSIFSYAYCKRANPPLEPNEDWQPKFKYLGVDGKKHTLGRQYEKTPVWKGSFSNKPREMTNAEFWTRSIPLEILEEHFVMIGPYERQDVLIPEYMKEMVFAERRYIQALWKLWEFQEQTGSDWASEGYQDKLSELLPRSWNCYSFQTPCEFIPICFKHPGWADPLGTGKFVLRRPHHEEEILQMEARGVEVPRAEVEEGVE